MSRRTGLSWMGTLAVGLGSLGIFGISTPAHAAPMSATLDGSGAMSQQSWQTAYLMAEGSAEAKVVGPLNRGARLEIDPAKSSDQYWFVKVPDSPGGAWQGYVWKDFVKVGEGGAKEPAPAPSAASGKVAPMADSLAQRDEPRKKAHADKGAKAEKAEKADAAPEERVVARPRVELEKLEAKPPKDSSLVAYDPELFEVSDAKDVKATPGADPGWDANAAARNKLVPPAASPAPSAPAVAQVEPAPEPAAPRVTETTIASPVRQIQALREQIEHELEAMPQTQLSANAAQNVDGLVARLNEVLKVERSMISFLESTTKMVEAHDQHIHDLQQRVTALASKGSDRTGLSDEVTHLRKRLDELSATVSTTRQHARRIDALEAQLRKTAPVAIEPGVHIESEHGSIVVGGTPDRDLDQRAGELESRLKASRRRASALARSIQSGPEEFDIPQIDARSSEKVLAQNPRAKAAAKRDGDRQVEEGVVEVVNKEPELEAVPPADRLANARAEGRESLEKGAGLENGTVAAMLKKLRDLREQRRREREQGVVEVTAPQTAEKPKARAKAERAAAPDLAPIGSGAPPELEPVPDDMREDDPSVTPDDSKNVDTSKIKANRRAAREKRMRLGAVENLLTAHL